MGGHKRKVEYRYEDEPCEVGGSSCIAKGCSLVKYAPCCQRVYFGMGVSAALIQRRALGMATTKRQEPPHSGQTVVSSSS